MGLKALSRIKNWLGLDNFTSSDINAEFNNLFTGVGSDTVSGASGDPATLSGMQATENPGLVGSEVLPVTVQDEVRQLRYMLDQVIGGAQWYSAPPSNLTLLNAGLSSLSSQSSNRIVSGRADANGQPMFLVPDGASAKATLKATTTNFSAFVNGTEETASVDIAVNGLLLAPSSNNTALVNDASLVGDQASKTAGERATVITIDNIGANITALNGKYAAFKTSTEVFLAEVDTSNNQLKNCFRGFFFDSTDAWLARTALSNNDTLTLLKMTWFFYVFSSSASSVDISYNNPFVSFSQPPGPSIGDYWLDLSTNQWKKFSGVSFAAANAVLIGISAQNTSNCIAARSFDFANFFNELNNIELEYVDANNARSTKQNTQISVYGTSNSFNYDHAKWSMTTDLDAGETDSASTTYYFYVTGSGGVKISSVAPHQRVFDLLGFYHPAKPWRCVGQALNDGSSDFIQASVTSGAMYRFLFGPNQLPSSANAVVLANEALNLSSVSRGTADQAFVMDSSGVSPEYAKISQKNMDAVGQQVSSSSGSFSTTSASFTVATNLSVNLTTTGRPVMLMLIPDGSSTSSIGCQGSGGSRGVEFAWFRDSNQLTDALFFTGGNDISIPQGAVNFIDFPGAGNFLYTLQVLAHSSSTVVVQSCKIVAYEI